MSRTWRRYAVSLFAALILSPAAAGVAHAADLAKQWEVGADIVYSLYDNDSQISDTPGWAVRGGYHLNSRHAFELMYQVESTTEGAKGSNVTVDVKKWAIDYVFNFKTKKADSKITPLFLFGVGQMLYDNGFSSGDSTLYRGGGGLRYLFTRRVALRFDAAIFHYHGDNAVMPQHGFFGFDYELGVSFFLGQGK